MSSASNLEQAFTVDPTVVIDQLPPREPPIEQPAVTTNALPRRRWSRSQKGVLWTLGVAIYGLTLTNIFAWESKENKEQPLELEKTRNSEQVTTASSMPDLAPTTVTSLDFPPVNSTSLPENNTTTTTARPAEAFEIDLPGTSNTSLTTIATDEP